MTYIMCRVGCYTLLLYFDAISFVKTLLCRHIIFCTLNLKVTLTAFNLATFCALCICETQ